MVEYAIDVTFKEKRLGQLHELGKGKGHEAMKEKAIGLFHQRGKLSPLLPNATSNELQKSKLLDIKDENQTQRISMNPST